MERIDLFFWGGLGLITIICIRLVMFLFERSRRVWTVRGYIVFIAVVVWIALFLILQTITLRLGAPG